VAEPSHQHQQLLSPLTILKRKQERGGGGEGAAASSSAATGASPHSGLEEQVDQRRGRGLHDSLELEYLIHNKKKKKAARSIVDESEEGGPLGLEGEDLDDDGAMMDTMATNDIDQQIETNGPPTAGDREFAFHTLRSKMGHLEEVIEDIGQFICENQLEDHFINFVFRLSSVSKDLNTEISTVESYLEFIVRRLLHPALARPGKPDHLNL
jgi:hypothetical protein